MITNKYNNISSQDALFNNVTIRDTLKSDSIEANKIIKSNPGSTGRIILNGTLTVSGNDNSIDTIKNVNITNNELIFENKSGTTTANKITQENGMTNITGGNITFNHTLKVTGDNHNISTISDANITNNKEMKFINETANTSIDNITGESTITNGNISFDNIVTINNEQDNQNNITSITNSNITNNNSMSFTNETANTTIDNLQRGEGDLTITGGNINTNNIITITNESTITSLTNANITNSGTITLNKASIDKLITSIINGSKTLNDSLKETKFKYKEETLKKSTDNVIGTKYYNIPYVKELDNVTYYGELVNKTEELDNSNVKYDMKYYYADIIYYQYQNKIIIPENQSVNVNKADQISLVNADVTNNGTLNISDGSVIQEIIGDVKFSGKVNLEAVTEIRDVDNIILEDAIITNNKGINITGESTITSIIDSNIGGDVTIDTTGQVTINNVINSTITNGTVTINDNITSTVTNSNLIGSTVNFGENKTLTVDVKEGTLENEIIKTITDSTINNANVTLNNNITSTVTNSDLNTATIDLNSNTLITKEGVISSFNNINNSTITNGNVTVNNNLTSTLANAVLNNNVIVNLNNKSLTAQTGSSISNINNSTLTNGTLTINNDITSKVTNSSINNGTVDLNNRKLTANGDITLINITGGNITNTGTIEAKGTITARQINSNLLKDQSGNNQIMAYDKDNKKITFCNHTTLTCNGEEDTLTTDNLIIDRITLNEIREVDGGIITTGLKVGFPYWTDLGTTEQGSIINIEGNILHVVKVLVDGVNHYQLWISMMDIEFSLKSTETKIITKGPSFDNSDLINSLDDLELGEDEHLYIKSANVPIANGKMLNAMTINASIDADGTINGNSLQLVNASINNGVITGKSLQTNQISNENGDKSLIKYEPAGTGTNPKITLGSEGVDLEIVGFDQKNLNCETVIASNYVQSNLLQSNDGNNKQIIKYEPGSASTNPKITLGTEGVDLEIVGFDQKNIVCETLTATKRIKADLMYSSDDTISILGQIGAILQIGDDKNTSNIQVNFTNLMKIFGNLQIANSYRLRTDDIYSSDNNTPLIHLDSSTVTVGSQNKTTSIYNLNVTHDLIVDNNIYSDIIYSKQSTTTPIFTYYASNTLTLGNNTTRTKIARLSTNTIADYLNNTVLFSYKDSNHLEIGSADSNYLYTLIHKIKTTDPLYVSSLNYWDETIKSMSLIRYDPSNKTITIGDSSIPTMQKMNGLTVDTGIYTNNIYSNTTDKYSLLKYENTSTVTKKITLGSASTTQETNNLTVTTNLKVANRIYADNIYSSSSIGNPIVRFETTTGLATTSGILLGSLSGGKNNIYHSIVYDLYSYTRNRRVFGEASDSNVTDSDNNALDNFVFFGNSKYAYTLIYNLRTNEPLYAPSIYYWPTNTAKTSAIPLLDYVSSNNTITLGNTTTNISIPGTLITESIKDSENDSIISVDTETDIITIGNDNKQTIIKNVDYSDIFNKIYVSMGQNIKFKIDPKIAIDKAIKTVDIATITVTKNGETITITNVTAYQNADNIYNNYTTGQIFLNRLSTSTDTTTEVDVYIIPKKRNFFNHPTNTGAFYTRQTARMCFVFCNLYFIIKSPTENNETSSGLWTSSNGSVWYEFSPKDFNNKTGPYSDTTVTGAKFNISQTTTINSLSIGYISRNWITGYEQYEDHYVLGFPLITVSNEAYYAAFLLYDYDEYMTREVTYDGGCTIL